jgi:hypothetical protein
MAKEPHVLVTKERDVRTYSELWHASDCVLTAGQENPKGSSWQFLSSALLTAFTFEAYLNHVGPTLFTNWKHFDRLPPWAKFELLCDKLNVTFVSGSAKRPLQTVTKLLSFRNTIAHGRTEQVQAAPLKRTVENYQAALGEDVLADWEKLIRTDEFAVRARDDVKAVLTQIHAARPDPKEHLFTFGLGARRASLIIDS